MLRDALGQPQIIGLCPKVKGGRIQERTLEEGAKTALAVTMWQNCVESDPKRAMSTVGEQSRTDSKGKGQDYRTEREKMGSDK